MSMPLLQPHEGPIPGRHYLASTVDTVTWGWLPAEGAAPVAQIGSGETITVDTVSHEGIMEDQGRDPVAFFGQFGIDPGDVLRDAVGLAGRAPGRRARGDGPPRPPRPQPLGGAGTRAR
ncbi:acetamidase, partial [Streptomyces sp. NPDC058255]